MGKGRAESSVLDKKPGLLGKVEVFLGEIWRLFSESEGFSSMASSRLVGMGEKVVHLSSGLCSWRREMRPEGRVTLTLLEPPLPQISI